MSSDQNPVIVVPARLKSTRFPNKLLADVYGKPLVLVTAERLREEAPEFQIFFAVDDPQIQDVLEENNFRTIMTDPLISSGTERIAVANKILMSDIVINVQADEPLIRKEHIINVFEGIQRPGASISTVATFFRKESDFRDQNQVKVVLKNNGFALYFSRSPIPFARDTDEKLDGIKFLKPLKHIGIYAYKKEFLEDFLVSEESQLERVEKLEQLRALQNGYEIAVAICENDSIGIDVPSDLKFLRRII